jgi:hypothetical protein
MRFIDCAFALSVCNYPLEGRGGGYIAGRTGAAQGFSRRIPAQFRSLGARIQAPIAIEGEGFQPHIINRLVGAGAPWNKE